MLLTSKLYVLNINILLVYNVTLTQMITINIVIVVNKILNFGCNVNRLGKLIQTTLLPNVLYIIRNIHFAVILLPLNII